jgi:hypothetical protein
MMTVRSVTFFISMLAGRLCHEEEPLPEELGFTDAASKAGWGSVWAGS